MGPIILCIVFLSVFSIVLVLYLWLSEYYEVWQTLGFIPGPKTYPFIGLAWKIAKVPYEGRFKWLNDLCFSFKNGMVLTWFGVEPILNIRKPHQIQVILSSRRFLQKSRMYKILTPKLANGLLTASDDIWHDHKRLLKFAFELDTLEDYVAVMHRKVEILKEGIRERMKKYPKLPINIFELAIRYTLDSICENALGIDMDIQRNTNNLYLNGFTKFSRISTERYFKFWHKWDFIFYRTKRGKALLHVIHKMQELTEKLIRKKKEERLKKTTSKDRMRQSSGNSRRKTFLDFLLEKSENTDDHLSIKEIQEEIDTFIFIGYSTISAAISWTLFSLGNEPDIQAKVRKELKKVIGENDNQVSIKQLIQLKYLDRVIKEVLRLYPSIPIASRSIENDAVIDLCFIPEGTLVNIHIYQLHRDPEVWENPNLFDPDRFLPENSNGRHPYAYIPFSIGPRECIGQKFTFLEIKIALVSILRNWKFSSVLKPSNIAFVPNFTLRPYNDKIELYFSQINSN